MTKFIQIASIIWWIQYIQAFNFTKIENPTGAFLIKNQDTYISYNDWKLIYYFELRDINENFEKYKTCLQKMEKLCKAIPNKDQCETLLKLHNNTLSEINNI